MSSTKYVKDIDRGLKKFMKEMRAADNAFVTVGVHEGERSMDGTNIAEYATYNEYGAEVKAQAREQVIYRRVKTAGKSNGQWTKRHGQRFVKKDKSNFMSMTQVAAHTFNIPSRPFMRTAFDQNIEAINRDMKDVVNGLKRGQNIAVLLKVVGEKQQRRIKKIISTVDFLPKLADSTIKKKKGSTKTLIDSGALRNSIRYVVHK